MNPPEVKTHRLALGLSRVDFGKALGLNGEPNNIRTEVMRWERDKSKASARPIPANRELALLTLLKKEK